MKKTKLILLFLITFYFVSNCNAQKLYLSSVTGYNFAFKNSCIPVYDTYYEGDNKIQNFSNITNASLGKGMNFGLGIGYKISKSIDFIGNFSYLYGKEIKYTTVDENKIISAAPPNYYYVYDVRLEKNYELYSRFYYFNPLIKIHTSRVFFNPYIKFGIILGKGKIYSLYNEKMNEKYISTIGDFEDIKETEETLIKNQTYFGNFSIGYNTCFGVDFSLTKNLSLFSELNLISVNYLPSNSIITKYVKNDDDILNDLTTSEKEINFVNAYQISSNEPINENEPKKVLKQNYSMESIGIILGLSVSF